MNLFANPSFGGKAKDFSGSCGDLTEYLPDGAESVIVEENSEPWQVFTKVQFEGNSKVLYPGSYEKLKEIGLKSPVKSFRKAPARPALKFFETHTFGGNKKAFSASCDDLTIHLPEGASSVLVNEHSPAAWQVFTEARFRGTSVTLKPGARYENLEQMGLNIPLKSFRKAPPGRGKGFVSKMVAPDMMERMCVYDDESRK